jgi:hypothetical protein
MSNEGNGENFEDQLKKLWEGKDDKIEEAKATLIDHYTKQQNAQGTRLIGFVAGLFVLLQVTQTSIEYGLTKIFPNLSTIIISGNIAILWDVLKFLFLFLLTSAILFYTLRTIFRYAVFGILSTEVMWVTKDEAREIVRVFAKKDNEKPEYYEFRELWVVHRATASEAYGKNIYWKIKARWFMASANPEFPSCENTGFWLCGAFALILAFILLIFLW